MHVDCKRWKSKGFSNGPRFVCPRSICPSIRSAAIAFLFFISGSGCRPTHRPLFLKLLEKEEEARREMIALLEKKEGEEEEDGAQFT